MIRSFFEAHKASFFRAKGNQIKMWGNSRAKLDYAALVCKPYLVVDSKKERSSKTNEAFSKEMAPVKVEFHEMNKKTRFFG